MNEEDGKTKDLLSDYLKSKLDFIVFFFCSEHRLPSQRELQIAFKFKSPTSGQMIIKELSRLRYLDKRKSVTGRVYYKFTVKTIERYNLLISQLTR